VPAETRTLLYDFVGGSRDGDQLPHPTRVTAGSRVAFPLVADPARAEVYVFLVDGRFHFVGFMWRGAAGDAAVTGNVAYDRALLEQVDLLRLVLDQLGELFRHTGYPRGLVIGDWLVSRRDVAGGSPAGFDAGVCDRNERPGYRRTPDDGNAHGC
jgi:hypothetical protein